MKSVIINLYDGELKPNKSFRLVVLEYPLSSVDNEPLWIRCDVFEGYRLKDGSKIWKENGICKGIVVEIWEEDKDSRDFTIPIKYLSRVADALKKLDKELNKEV